MARWRFYQGLRTEWRWYHVDDHGSLIAESDRGFAELQGCMANAEEAGFSAGEAFQVYTRQAGSFGDTHPIAVDEAVDDMPLSSDADTGAADEQPAT
jgi:hypothetical protein